MAASNSWSQTGPGPGRVHRDDSHVDSSPPTMQRSESEPAGAPSGQNCFPGLQSFQHQQREQASMKVLLTDVNNSRLPSYEDATAKKVTGLTLRGGESDRRIISTTCVNAELTEEGLTCEQTTIIKMKANKEAAEVELCKNLKMKPRCGAEVVVAPRADGVAPSGTENTANLSNNNCNDDNSSNSAIVAPTLLENDRVTWDNSLDFLLSIIGFAVDLANVWRFPYLCYKNGGGAFLIPYLLMLLFGALPLFYMEVILGQFNREGPISLWKICPIFKGVGFCAVFIAFYVSFYYNVIIGWSLFYVAHSFALELPWNHCNNSWNTEFCVKTCADFNNSTTAATATFNSIPCSLSRSPAKEYFNLEVLQIQHSSGITDIGTPIPMLTACIFIVYCVLYLSLFKGVKSSGKVVWVTATMPYVLLTILLCRGLMLPGAMKGIHFYLVPNLGKLYEKSVWIDAAIQIFYSVGAGFGVHLAYASYNKFDNNCYRDCLVTSAVNSLTSFFSGFVIFTYLGYMSDYQGRDIEQVAEQGPGLVFEVYPEAIGTLPGSQVWSLLFFATLILLGMDSAMGGLECVITGLMDEFKSTFTKYNISRETFTGMVVSVSFLVALSCVTPGGFYIFNLLETYVAGLSLLATVFFEAIAVSWLYGLEHFKSDVNKMLGHTPNLYWRICWKIISPAFLFVVMVLQMFEVGPLVIGLYNKTEYVYPSGAKAVGWVLALSSILMVPLIAVKTVTSKPGGIKQKLLLSITPESEHLEILEGRPGKRATAEHWFSL